MTIPAGPVPGAGQAPSAGQAPGAGQAPAAHTGPGKSPKPVKTAKPVGTAKPTKVVVSGPRIVYFRIAQKPKCAEGTAVFRADPVPLVITWKITGAVGGALSVDDTTGTPGTYGPVELEGSQEFSFSCNGEVGSTEKHTYAIYTTGGGPVRSKTITASAKVLDQGIGAN